MSTTTGPSGAAGFNSAKQPWLWMGGGIRGAFTLGFLGKLESLITRETDKGKDFALADYFDFIGGASTGAIIATGLSSSWTLEKLTSMYREFGAAVGCNSSGGALG